MWKLNSRDVLGGNTGFLLFLEVEKIFLSTYVICFEEALDC